jgi:hypothetical protein
MADATGRDEAGCVRPQPACENASEVATSEEFLQRNDGRTGTAMCRLSQTVRLRNRGYRTGVRRLHPQGESSRIVRNKCRPLPLHGRVGLFGRGPGERGGDGGRVLQLSYGRQFTGEKGSSGVNGLGSCPLGVMRREWLEPVPSAPDIHDARRRQLIAPTLCTGGFRHGVRSMPFCPDDSRAHERLRVLRMDMIF